MGEGSIGWVGMVSSLILIVIAVALSAAQRLGLGRSIVIATGRAMVQLLLVGFALGLVIDPSRPVWWSWVWVAGMVTYAAYTVSRRASEVPALFPVALAALVTAAGLSLAVIFGLRIFPHQGRAIIPLAGMMIGNSMTATVVAARRIVSELADRAEVEARLALGLSSADAARPYLRAALRTALTNQVETTKTVGLVFLPGAMTGLILAGVTPLDATMVQAAIMFLILGSAATTVTVVGLGLRRRLFTPDHRLVPLRRTAG